ncbi:MAG: universal stress protein [Haloarculaceae archaeon]
MTRLLVGTDGQDASERIAEYLAETVDEEDDVYIINSHVGGDKTTADDVRDGEEALDILEDASGAAGSVKRNQFVRGNHPIEDLLEAAENWDADEYVIGIRKRTPVGKMVFGSTAQNLLLEADRTVRCVPIVSE